jgi:hypothetical protein
MESEEARKQKTKPTLSSNARLHLGYDRIHLREPL